MIFEFQINELNWFFKAFQMVLTMTPRISKITQGSSKSPPDQIYFQRGECIQAKVLVLSASSGAYS